MRVVMNHCSGRISVRRIFMCCACLYELAGSQMKIQLHCFDSYGFDLDSDFDYFPALTSLLSHFSISATKQLEPQHSSIVNPNVLIPISIQILSPSFFLSLCFPRCETNLSCEAKHAQYHVAVFGVHVCDVIV